MKNQTIGVEIEMNHITRERAARIAAGLVGKGATDVGRQGVDVGEGGEHGNPDRAAGTYGRNPAD